MAAQFKNPDAFIGAYSYYSALAEFSRRRQQLKQLSDSDKPSAFLYTEPLIQTFTSLRRIFSALFMLCRKLRRNIA